MSSCYICLEEDGQLMTTKGCSCKGSISIHRSCLQEWLQTTDNPFQCAVCKTEYDGSFLNLFLSKEEILFHPTTEEEEEEEYGSMYDFHGISIMEVGGELLFESEEHRSIYNQTNSKQYRDIKCEARRQQKKVRTLSKHVHQPRQSRRQLVRLK